jgi:hypothetical protein
MVHYCLTVDVFHLYLFFKFQIQMYYQINAKVKVIYDALRTNFLNFGKTLTEVLNKIIDLKYGEILIKISTYMF